MRIAIVLPFLLDLSGSAGTGRISGAALALNVFARRYANDPEVEALELYLAPRDLLNPDAIRGLASLILEPANFGRGKLEIHSIYAIPDVWGDGRERIIHTDDLHLFARDRDLRDRYAKGPTPIACDIHCMGHKSSVDSLRLVARMPRNSFDRIYATSASAAEAINATFETLGAGLHTSVQVQPRMIDPAGLNPCSGLEEKSAIRRKLGLPEEGVIALSIGRMSVATKGDLAVLVEVFAEAAGRDHHLVIAGHEEVTGYAELVLDLAARLGASERVHIIGGFGIGSRGELYRASDFLVFPADSGNEVFGQVTVEAMACGLPVLGTDWDGLKDTIEHGVTGFKVPTYTLPRLGRFDGLTQAADEPTTLLLRAQATVIDRHVFGAFFTQMLEDSDLRQRMGRAAVDAYRTRFHPERLYPKLIAAFHQQLQAAGDEPVSSREERQRWAAEHALTVPAFEQFERYGTRPLLATDHRFKTTAKGLAALKGTNSIELFPEVTVVLPVAVIELLLSKLSIPRNALDIQEIATQSQIPYDVLHFGLAALCKRGYISLERTGSNPLDGL